MGIYLSSELSKEKRCIMSEDNVSTGSSTEIHTESRRPIELIAARIVWFIFGFIEVLIGVRFVLKLLGANAESGFVQFIHGFSNIFMAPFFAILDTSKASGAVFEWSALVAIVVYALVAWGIVALIKAVSPRRDSQTIQTTQQDDTTTARQD